MFSDTKYPVHKDNHFRYIYSSPAENSVPIVFLHGLFGGLSNFEALLDRFADYHPVFVPELPLYADMQVTPSVRSLTDWLIEKLEVLELVQPVLVGNSMGGHMALDVALRYPEHVRGLVLAGSSGLMENHFGQSKPRRYDREYVRQQASRTFFEKELEEPVIDEIMSVLQSPRKLIRMLRLARSTQRYNLEHLLGRVKHPVLLIWGRNDIITPPEVGESFHHMLPDSELEWIDRCGHAPMMERPEAFGDIMNDFFKRRNWLESGHDSVKQSLSR